MNKIQEKEFPVPHVVIEAIYRPQPNPQSPNFTPGDAQEHYRVLANQEPALREHLQRQSSVQCQLRTPPPGSCVPGTVALNLQPFDAMADGQQADTAPKPSGCAQIESQATQDQMQKLGTAATAIPEEFQFQRNSAEPPGDVGQVVNQIAQRIRGNPRLECIAVVGQVAPGENQALADQRARAIKNLLLENGIDPARLIVITNTASVFGSGTGPPPDEPEKRRVRLRVLLENKNASE